MTLLRNKDTLPKAYNNCACDCHRKKGVVHVMPCCYPGDGDYLPIQEECFEDDYNKMKDSFKIKSKPKPLTTNNAIKAYNAFSKAVNRLLRSTKIKKLDKGLGKKDV